VCASTVTSSTTKVGGSSTCCGWKVTLVLTAEPEVLVGPRTLSRAAFDGAASESGFHVVTPFVLAETAQTVLVNRGWVPLDKKKPAARAAGQVQGEQTVQAIVRKSATKQGTFTPDNNPATNQWHWVDVQVFFMKDRVKRVGIYTNVTFLLLFFYQYGPGSRQRDGESSGVAGCRPRCRV
jgi:hypothetical protein